MVITSLILIIFLSFFTGHIITTPAVSLVSIIIIISLDKPNKKRIIILSVKENKISKNWLKELKKENIKVVEKEIKKDSKLSLLIFKVFEFKNYDLALSTEEVNSEYRLSASNNTLVLIDKEKDKKGKGVVTKQDFIKNLDYYMNRY